ncbi:hypothetical protein [uncultured Cyclobacterium sp.]|uniref:hypothetical protein n=1 Tax=uncultured Cyclobacterium sp. TaxID=453820 RepID=UPI0030EB5FF2|tara:strand:+ start:249 stop:407 length:159 start_codon:yes stop_codon:yes gene_type:complete
MEIHKIRKEQGLSLPAEMLTKHSAASDMLRGASPAALIKINSPKIPYLWIKP